MAKSLDRAVIRRWNTRLLADGTGGSAAFAGRLGKGSSQISQLIGNEPRRAIGNGVAAQIERAFDKPVGWLDIPRPGEWEGITNKKWRSLMEGEFRGLVREMPNLGHEAVELIPGPEAVLRRVAIVGDTERGAASAWLAAGQPNDYGTEFLNAPATDQAAYALKVIGTALSPRMREGEVVSVSPNTEPQPGDEVVVKMVSGETLIKQLIYRRDDEVALSDILDGTRIVRRLDEIESIHVINGVFRASSVERRLSSRDTN